MNCGTLVPRGPYVAHSQQKHVYLLQYLTADHLNILTFRCKLYRHIRSHPCAAPTQDIQQLPNYRAYIPLRIGWR